MTKDERRRALGGLLVHILLARSYFQFQVSSFKFPASSFQRRFNRIHHPIQITFLDNQWREEA
jgi:hypothetical protein